MSDLKPHEVIKLNNFAAHKEKLLGEIADANKSLTETLGKVEVAQKDLDAINALIPIAKELLRKTEARTKESLRVADTKIKEVEKIAKDLQEQIAAFETYKTEETKKLSKDRAASEAVVLVNEEKIPGLLARIEELQDEIVKKDAELSAIEGATETIAKEREELEEIVDELEEYATDLKKDIASGKENLAAIEAIILEEVEKIGKPFEVLKEQAAIMLRKERNIKVMTARLEKVFARIYPGKVLKL